MIEICHIAASELSSLEVLNETTIENAITDLSSIEQTRIIVVDHKCASLFDSARSISSVDRYVLYPEVITSLQGNDVFFWRYHAGAMQSFASTPIISYGKLIGCVYITEYDTNEGALIASIQNNIFVITLFLEIVVVFFSIISANTYSHRLRKIMSSIRTVRDGDYFHKVTLSGHDELNMLGNEFNDLISKLQISERKRSQFVSDASHELKTPLASIKLLSDSILQNNMDYDTVREFVGDIGNEAERLNKMSQKLLSLSKSDDNLEENHEVVYLAPIIHRVIRMLSLIADKNNISIITELDDHCAVYAQEDDLYQVIFNLIENGIKYNTHGGQLLVRLYQDNQAIVLCIKDTGVGIPPESLPHVFERFYRVDKARSRSTGGSGLGLSIVRSIVKRNNGEIIAESTVNEGTTFTVHFPKYIPEENQR